MKLGLALSSAGQSLCGIAGVSSISGGHGWLVEYAVIVGFFMGVAGNFFTVLFTNGHHGAPKKSEIKEL